MMAGATWSSSWRETGSWALTTLEDRLGSDWPAEVARKAPDGSAHELAWAVGHVVAYAQVLEWALRLELLAGSTGFAKVRQAIRNDPRPAQLAHCRVQLEVAALALRRGSRPELEPGSARRRPADVAFSAGGRDVVVETRVILISDDWQEQTLKTDQLFERIRAVETRYGVRCEGVVSEFVVGREADDLVTAVEERARLVAVGLEPLPLRHRAATLDIVPNTRTHPGGLSGPEIRGDSWARIAPRIVEKVQAAAQSGANWLRLDALNGLWQFTRLATMSLREKANALGEAVRSLPEGLDGVILSSGALLTQGSFDDEDVEAGPGLAAVRRNLPFSRVRETVIISNRNTPDSSATWLRDLYASEPGWLDWSLERLGLPSTVEILAR
jgi:hypothetical protein